MRQAASCNLVRGNSTDREGEERHLVGGTRPLSCYQVANGWTKKQKTMAVMVRREGESPPLAEWRSMTLVSRGAHAVGRAADTGPLWLRSRPLRGSAAQGEAAVGRELPKTSDRVRLQAPTDLGNGGYYGRPRRLERSRRGHVQPPGNPRRAGPGTGPHGTVPTIEFDARKYQECDNGTYREVEPDSKLHARRSSHQSHALLRDHRGMTFVIKPANL